MLYQLPEDLNAFLCYLRHKFSIKLLSNNKQEKEFLRLRGNTFNIHFVDSAECRSTIKLEHVV